MRVVSVFGKTYPTVATQRCFGHVSTPTGAQLALIPASGGVTQEWARSKVVRGERAGKAGATEDQGWYSQEYDDASVAPVLVYDFVYP